MSLAEAAAETPFSIDTLRRAVKTTGVDKDGNPTFPPPLRAKRGAKDRYVVLAPDLTNWLESLQDA